MKKLFVISLLVVCSTVYAQNANPLDIINYGVILDDPKMKEVKVKLDVPYLEDEKGKLHIDIYALPGMKAGEKRPAIIFLNAIGDAPDFAKIKTWGIYKSWPRLMAAQGYIGISMEADGSRIQESLQALFDFLQNKGAAFNIDKDKLGVYAASANVTQSSKYLMSDQVSKGIKAAVLYYGRPPVGPFRKDLPVFFLISEGDMNSGYNGLWSEVLKNNAPWTIKMGTRMPHAFDAITDNEEARILIKETISFWKNYLDPVPVPSWQPSKGRDIVGNLQMNRPKAMTLLNSLVAEYPNNTAVLKYYANELRQDKKYDSSALVYNKVLQLEPGDVQALTALAVFSYIDNKEQEAQAYVTKAASTGKIGRGDYSRMAFFLLVANKNKEAAAYYEKAIAISPNSFDAYNLACAYAKMNDVGNALKHLDYSVKNGYGTKGQIDADTDFDLIRSNEKFKELVTSIK